MKKLFLLVSVLFSTLFMSNAIGQTFPNQMKFYVPDPNFNADYGQPYKLASIPECYSYVYPNRWVNAYPIRPGDLMKIQLLNGSGVTYQWYIYLLGFEMEIAGQTSATLNHRLDYDANRYMMVYKCKVTSSTGQQTYQASFYVSGPAPSSVDATNGVEELTNENGEDNAENILNVDKLNIVTVFPNPANEFIRVELDGLTTSADVVKVSIFDEKVGTQVKRQQNVNEKNFEINVSTLPQGKYILTVEKDGVKDSKRFYINR